MRRNGKQKEQKEEMNCDEEQVNYRVRQLPCLGSVPEQDHKLCKDSGKKKLLNVRRHKNRTFLHCNNPQDMYFCPRCFVLF